MPPGRRSIFDTDTVAPFGPHHSFMRSGSVKHFHKTSRGALNTREMTKSALLVAVAVAVIVSIHSLRLGARRDHCATMTIQPMPNLSVSMPNFGEKNVLVSGMVTLPPLDNAAKVLSASPSSLAVTVSEKPLKSGLPLAMPSEPITMESPILNDACMILFSSDGMQFGFFSGLSLKRIIISTLAPSVFL